MHQVVVEWIGAFGYWGVFALIAVENIFPPIPSEVILTFEMCIRDRYSAGFSV